MEAGELPSIPPFHIKADRRPSSELKVSGMGARIIRPLYSFLSLLSLLSAPVSLTHRRPYPSHFLYVPSSSPALSRPNFYLRHVSPPPSSFFRPEGVVSSHEKGRRRELALIIVIKREREPKMRNLLRNLLKYENGTQAARVGREEDTGRSRRMPPNVVVVTVSYRGAAAERGGGGKWVEKATSQAVEKSRRRRVCVCDYTVVSAR